MKAHGQLHVQITQKKAYFTLFTCAQLHVAVCFVCIDYKMLFIKELSVSLNSIAEFICAKLFETSFFTILLAQLNQALLLLIIINVPGYFHEKL